MAHERRACSRCSGAGTVPRCATPASSPIMEHCSYCSGLGITLAFVYERVAPNLRRRDAAEVLWLSWHGTARERRAADKELEKRNGDAR